MRNKIEIAYILSAGLGSRMGPLGKKLPKVMWPIFEGVMLDLQIKYARSLGMKKIYINTHHCAEVIEKYIQELKYSDVILIHEKELLDSGGAIHNLIDKFKVREKILVLNGDQFFFSPGMFDFISLCEKSDATAILLEIKVNKGEKYNRLCVSKGLLTQIIQSNDKDVEKYPTTYSGIAVINLKDLKFLSGASKFFESVANYKTSQISCVTLSNYEYWDFGTIENYLARHNEIITKILNQETDSEFLRFIQKEGALLKDKIHRKSAYNSNSEMNYIFSPKFKIVINKIFYENDIFSLE